MKILVLGGDGFLGSHFVDQAVGLGYEVTVFDRFSYNVSKNLEHHRGKVRFVSGEFANRAEVANILENQDVVYHFISATNPITSWNDPFIEIEENLRYSIQLFELAAAHSVRKIVFSSSGGTIYGRQCGPTNEKSLSIPFSPHGICKLATEYFLNYFRERNNIATDVYRIGNAYGPRQPMQTPQGVIAVWMGKILEKDEIQVYGDRDTLRDYVYVEDIAYLMTNSIRYLESSDVYNLGTGRGVSILELLDIFREIINVPFKYRILPRRQSDNSSVILDSSKLTSFFPEFKFQRLEDRIRDTWLFVEDQYRKKHETLSSNK